MAAPKPPRETAHPNETELQKACQARLTFLGGYCMKIHGSSAQRKGTPDLIGVLRGRAIAARAAADAAFGAVTAFSTYVLDGLAGLPVTKADPRQLSLFAAAG